MQYNLYTQHINKRKQAKKPRENDRMKPLYADSLGFLGFPGKPVVVPDGLKLDLVHMTAAPPWCKTMDETIAAIYAFEEQITRCPQLQIVTKGAEIEPAIAAGKTAVVLGLQHTPEDASHITWPKKLRSTGVRVMALAYQKKCNFGSGWVNADLPLGLHGVDMIHAMKATDLILDVSHASHASAREAVRYAKTLTLPIMASHGGCYRRFPHMRNLPDDVLRDIAKLGGVIGIFTLTFCLDAENNTLQPFARHLRHALEVCGKDAVCVGGDGPYTPPIPESEIRTEYERVSGELNTNDIYNARFPDHPLECFFPNRMEVLQIAMHLYGVPETVIPKVLGGNLLSFFKHALV